MRKEITYRRKLEAAAARKMYDSAPVFDFKYLDPSWGTLVKLPTRSKEKDAQH